MSKSTLADTLNRLRQNDKELMKELFHQHYANICKTIYRFVQKSDLSEDLAQEVFIKFWEKRNDLNINSSIAAYLNRMAINNAISYLRTNKKYQLTNLEDKDFKESNSSAEQLYLDGELKDNIHQAINHLPPQCGLVFKMSRFEELSYKEIAAKLDISIKTVENHMGKALKLLRKALKSYLNSFF